MRRVLLLTSLVVLVASFGACSQSAPEATLPPVIPSAPPPGSLSLAEEANRELALRTNAGSADFTGPRNPPNFFVETPRLARDFWLAGVTNILAGSQAQITGGLLLSCANYMTPVTPHLCVVTWHTVHGADGFLGRTNLWLRPDGTLYTNVSLLATNVFGDLGLVMMADTNWTTVKILPDISPRVAAWREHNFRDYAAPCAVRFHMGIGNTNRFHTTFVSGLTGLGTFGHVPGQLEFGNYAFGDRWVSGDSSGPAYLILNNEAVFLGQVSSGNLVMPPAVHAKEVAAAAAALCAQYHLPPEAPVYYDVSGFRPE